MTALPLPPHAPDCQPARRNGRINPGCQRCREIVARAHAAAARFAPRLLDGTWKDNAPEEAP